MAIFGKESRNLDHFGVMDAMHIGDLLRIGDDLLVILLEISMVSINDVVDEEGECPRGIILAPLRRFILYRRKFVANFGKIEAFFRANGRESNITATTEIDSVLFKDLGSAKIGSDNLADGSILYR